MNEIPVFSRDRREDDARTAEAHRAALAVGPRAACAGADLFNTQCFRGEAA